MYAARLPGQRIPPDAPLAVGLAMRRSQTSEAQSIIQRAPRCHCCGQPEGLWAIDQVTGLLGRWGWYDTAPEIFAHSRSVALLLADVDMFKEINDNAGYLAGDDVLRHVAGALQHASRKGDVLCRFGGDEFVALLPGADLATATTVADNVGHIVSTIPTPPNHIQELTVSIGIAATSSTLSASLDRLFTAANSRLMTAKRSRHRKLS